MIQGLWLFANYQSGRETDKVGTALVKLIKRSNK